MHLILTGATGLVGSAVLQTMLTTPQVTKISILSRKPVAQAEGHAKANVIIHKDYNVYPGELMAQLKDAKGVVWAQGISAMKVGKEEYEMITRDYPLAFAEALSKTASPNPVNFIYVSGEGATTSPGLLTQHWARIKGITEARLVAMSKTPEYGNLRPISLRPGGVDPKEHVEIHPFIPVSGALLKGAATIMRGLMPSMMSPTKDLGKVLVQLAMGDGGVVDGPNVEGEGRTVRNIAMLRLAGLNK